MIERDLTKLPKWAQEYIQDLMRELNRQKDAVDDAHTEHPGSNVVVRSHAGVINGERTLPNNSRVVFYMEDDRGQLIRSAIEVHHANDAYGPELYLSADSGRLVVLPSASNSARLRIDPR